MCIKILISFLLSKYNIYQNHGPQPMGGFIPPEMHPPRIDEGGDDPPQILGDNSVKMFFCIFTDCMFCKLFYFFST